MHILERFPNWNASLSLFATHNASIFNLNVNLHEQQSKTISEVVVHLVNNVNTDPSRISREQGEQQEEAVAPHPHIHRLAQQPQSHAG